LSHVAMEGRGVVRSAGLRHALRVLPPTAPMNHPTLRPLTFGEILDGAFSLYRRNFTTFFATALLPFVPLIPVWLVLGMIGATENVLRIVQAVLLPYSLFAHVLVWGALTRQAADVYQGEHLSIGAGFSAGLRRLLPLLGVTFLTLLLITVGLAFFLVPGLLILIMCFAVVPVVMLEGRGVFQSLGRSRALAKGAWGRIFAVLVVLMILSLLPVMTVGAAGIWGALGGGLDEAVAAGGFGFALGEVALLLGNALTTPLVTTGVLLQYFDRRVRAEGLDLEVAAQRLASVG
jgi:hypothetical protein